MFEIRIERAFTASHALRLPDGSMEDVHRHDWPVVVAVGSDGLDEMACVMDFHELERIVDGVLTPFEQAHLNDVEPFADGEVNPSAERVAQHIGQAVARYLPDGVGLLDVSVGEAPGCTAVFRP